MTGARLQAPRPHLAARAPTRSLALSFAMILALALPVMAPAAAWSEVLRPRPAPNRPSLEPTPEPAAAAPVSTAAAVPLRDPNRGAVTTLPLPRYVTLKGTEGNARRGPGITHRIDWVFTRAGMPLRVTAEYENWRRVEDVEGAGGWVHYSLLSGTRSALVMAEMTPVHSLPDTRAPVVFRAEKGVIARILACDADWCRLQADGQRGWAQKSTLWGVDAGEVVD